MKILIVSNLYPPYYCGGYEILCQQVCQELQNKGHEIFVLTSDYGVTAPLQENNIYRVLQLYVPFGQPASRMRMKRYKTSQYNSQQAKIIAQKIQPDIVFVWSQLRLTLGAAKALQTMKIPIVYTFNDEHISGYQATAFSLSPKRFINYLVDRWILPSITTRGLKFLHSTCISQMLKDNLLAKNVAIQNSRVIYQGIPIEKFPCKANPGAIHCPVRILYVGQLHQYKGVHTLLEAAKILHSKEIPIEVAIVGDGPEDYKQRLNSMIDPAWGKLWGKVPHDELPQIYRDHDIFVFPSIWQEPFGLTHLEAMASGTPVVSTADGGHGELLQDQKNALVFTKENAQDLAEKIMLFIENTELRQRIAEYARKIAAEHYSLQSYSCTLEKFLVEVHGGKQ